MTSAQAGGVASLAETRGQGRSGAITVEGRRTHVLLTVNASWNVVNFRSALIRALLADGHRVTVAAPEDERTPEIVALGCRFLPLRMDSKGLSVRREALLFRQILTLLRRERPDVVLSYTIKNNLCTALAGRILGIPVLPNVTGLGTAFLQGRVLTRVAKLLCRQAFAAAPVVLFQNDEDREMFVSNRLVAGTRTRVLPGSGIDLRHFQPAGAPSGGGVTFLYVGRILRDKGIFELVEAARTLRAIYPDVRFQLLGQAGSSNRTAVDQRTVDRWVAEGLLTHLGHQRDVRSAIAGADCVVLPSYREGTPRTLLEAAAMARPVVATDVAGCRSVVEHGTTGFLCRARDAGDLAAKLAEMIEAGPEARAEMGRLGREKMEREFGEDRVISAYREEIGRLVSGSQA